MPPACLSLPVGPETFLLAHVPACTHVALALTLNYAVFFLSSLLRAVLGLQEVSRGAQGIPRCPRAPPSVALVSKVLQRAVHCCVGGGRC